MLGPLRTLLLWSSQSQRCRGRPVYRGVKSLHQASVLKTGLLLLSLTSRMSEGKALWSQEALLTSCGAQVQRHIRQRYTTGCSSSPRIEIRADRITCIDYRILKQSHELILLGYSPEREGTRWSDRSVHAHSQRGKESKYTAKSP